MRSSIESIPDLLPAAPDVVLPIKQITTEDTAGVAAGTTATSSKTEDIISDNMEMNAGNSDRNEKNGYTYLKLLKEEIDKLNALATVAENELENGENLPDEASGKLRVASGKARLLVRQKLHQFEGLCHKNISQAADEQFPTTVEDLAGFCDMVMLQVVQVYQMFDEIEFLRKNNWVQVPTKLTENTIKSGSSKKTNMRSQLPKKSSTSGGNNGKSEAARRAREESRKKMMEERRRQMKEIKDNKNDNAEVEIFINN